MGVVRGAEEEGLNHPVVSFKSPADTPAMPGMLRKSAAFAPRYRKFESISLQGRVVCEPACWRSWTRRERPDLLVDSREK
jgi:hypothetical protein